MAEIFKPLCSQAGKNYSQTVGGGGSKSTGGCGDVKEI